MMTGRLIREMYPHGLHKVQNSFYEVPRFRKTIGREFLTGAPEMVYYIDRRTGQLKVKETTLLW